MPRFDIEHFVTSLYVDVACLSWFVVVTACFGIASLTCLIVVSVERLFALKLRFVMLTLLSVFHTV